MIPENEQRVNIQYSVKVNELPDLLNKMLIEAEERLCTIASTFGEHKITEVLKEHEGYQFGADKISELRLAMADLDYRLADCTAMLQGMVQLKATPQTTQQGTPSENYMDEINAAATKTQEMVEQTSHRWGPKGEEPQ
jgi:hypothetical protein